MADASVLGTDVREDVQVQVLSWIPYRTTSTPRNGE
jgi:hypothetical protein